MITSSGRQFCTVLAGMIGIYPTGMYMSSDTLMFHTSLIKIPHYLKISHTTTLLAT